MIDILIKNIEIIDGSGRPSFNGDIAIKGDKISGVGEIDLPAKEVIDGKGFIASPGFIDVHGHSDLFAFLDPIRKSKLCQGITTEICGQCGLGPAPVSKEFYYQYEKYFKDQGAPVYEESNSFISFSDYLDAMDKLPLGINMSYFIPHGMVRMAAMGLSHEKANKEQLEKMKQLVREGMKSGALGISTGLMYAPGMFADKDELKSLCEVLAEYDGIYTSHIRNQGNHLEESVAELIDIVESAGIRGNISHHKASGKSNWGKVKETADMIKKASVPIMHDVYPYTASSTMLVSMLPPYVQRMEKEEALAYLKDKNNYSELKDAIFNPSEDFESPLESCGYDGIMVFEASNTKDAIGKTLREYSEELGIDLFEAFIKVLADNNLGGAYIGFSMSEEDVETLIADPLCMYGTDGLYVEGMKMTHPRAIGTFPRILGKYVRDKKIITLEEAVRKMTSMPAEFYGFPHKGIIKEGYDGDIVIFDIDKIKDNANYNSPLLPNEGFEYVIVNGKIAVKNDDVSGIKNGKTLRVFK